MNIFDKLKIEQAVKDFHNMESEQKQIYGLFAKMMKTYYDLLLKEGFTEEQAMKIVIRHGIDPVNATMKGEE